jgi:tetratricopeptide (TPR) repeat protein
MKQLILLLLSMLMFLSCSKEPEKSREPVSAEKSIVEEVKEQTIKNPKDADAWYHLADLYENAQMHKEEVAALQKVVEIDPGKGYAYIKMGNAYNRLGQYQNAVTNYRTAIKYFPKNPVLYNNLAVSYGNLGKTDEEIKLLEKAISLRPHYASARHNLGITMLKAGKREEALKQYHELNKFDTVVAASLKKEIDAKEK